MAKKVKEPTIKVSKPVKQKISNETWILIDTCPVCGVTLKQKIPKETWILINTCSVCGVTLKENELYKVGRTKRSDTGLLSIRGHKECW